MPSHAMDEKHETISVLSILLTNIRIEHVKCAMVTKIALLSLNRSGSYSNRV